MAQCCVINYDYEYGTGPEMDASFPLLERYAQNAFKQLGKVATGWSESDDYLDVAIMSHDSFDVEKLEQMVQTLPAGCSGEGLIVRYSITDGQGHNIQKTFNTFVKPNAGGFPNLRTHIRSLIPSIYILEVVEVAPLEYRHRQHYPKYKTQTYNVAYTDTYEDAEKIMRSYIENRGKELQEWEELSDIYCFRIRRVSKGRMCQTYDYVSWCTYDAAGKLVDHSYCGTTPFSDKDSIEVFNGRYEEHIRFHEGDIVEVLNGDEVSLAVVMDTPLTWEWCQEHPSPYRDATDDTYTIITGPGYEWHEHVGCQYVFAPHYPLPPYLTRRFKEYYEKAAWANRVHDCATRNKEQIAQSAQCGCYACTAIFPSSDVTEYTDDGQTAICPKCSTDSIIGDASGFEITKPFLQKMRRKWFDY